MASVNARAQDYEDSGAFGDTRIDVLRAYAYLDLLNGVTAEARIACAEAQDEAAEAAEALAWAEARAARNAAGAQAGTGAEGEAGAGATPDRRTQKRSRNAPDDRPGRRRATEATATLRHRCGDRDGGGPAAARRPG